MTETRPAPRDECAAAALARLRRVVDLAVALNAVADVDRLLAAALDTVTAALDCEQAALLLYDDASGALRFAAATGQNRAALAAIPVPLEGSLAGACLRENRVVIAADTAADDRHFDAASGVAGVSVRALLAVPMRIDGRPVGVLEALNPTAGAFDAADVETLLVISAQAAVAVRNARQQDALRSANARLEDLDRARADFVTVASHELRTPLAAVTGFAQALRDDVDAEHQPIVDEVLMAARRMRGIVETLDELGAIRDDAGVISTERVDLRDVVTGPPGALAADGRRSVAVDLPAGPLPLDADARRLRLAFGHLLANADAFTPADGRIRIEADAADGFVTVRVCDSGAGLETSDLERIFEPFVQADTSDARAHEGLGVGLALARSVVLRHGGRLWATSAGPGQGSTFHVRLPLTG